MAVPRRVAAHIVRKPVVESAVCEVIENAGETTRVDLRELRNILADTAAPIDLETDIEVCAEPAEQTSAARSTRLAHTVRRAETGPIAREPPVTVEMAAQVAEVEPELAAAPIAVEPELAAVQVAEVAPELAAVQVAEVEPVAPVHSRAAIYATAAAVVVAAVGLMLVIMM